MIFTSRRPRSAKNKPSPHALYKSHRLAISTLENDNGVSLSHDAFESNQDIRRDLTLKHEDEVRLSITECDAHEIVLLLGEYEKHATETPHDGDITAPEPKPTTDSEADIPDLQSSSSGDRGTNLPPLRGKI